MFDHYHHQLSLHPDTTFFSNEITAVEHAREIQAEPCPCDDCPMHRECTVQGMACEDYQTYVCTGERISMHRLPSRRRARLVYAETDPPVRAVTVDDKLEAMKLAIRKGITNAAIATGINSTRIRRWLQAA